jgi:hypothetical protein
MSVFKIGFGFNLLSHLMKKIASPNKSRVSDFLLLKKRVQDV